MSGRILVIDDLPDWGSMIGGLLSDAGYDVRVAADEDSAMHLLRQQPYHVAVVDLRLDERDEQNRAGLGLARRMKEYFPELAVIILTAYADVESVRTALEPLPDGDSIAFDFLEKFDSSKLLSRVQMAFERAAKVNPQLQISFGLGLDWKHLKEDIECLRPLESQAAEQELRDLLQRLFHEAQRIHLKPLPDGHSSGSVVIVTPTTENIPQTDVVVKFNERKRAEQEALNYDRYVARFIGGARRTQRLDFRSTAHLGGIAYTFIGAKPAEFRRFRDLYGASNVSGMKRVLDNLFLETCQTWYANTLQGIGNKQAIGASYRKWLSLNNTKLRTAFIGLVGRPGDSELVLTDLNQPYQSSIRVVENDTVLVSPLLLSNAAFAYNGPFCYTHGDLHEDNILVDSHGQTWLIDFYQTGPAHPARDFALLESAIKFSLQTSRCSQATLQSWESSLLQVYALSEDPSVDWSLPADPELTKATKLIVHIRSLLQQLVPDMSLRDYLVALYFHALKAMTLTEKFGASQRSHALISAALLAEVLQ